MGLGRWISKELYKGRGSYAMDPLEVVQIEFHSKFLNARVGFSEPCAVDEPARKADLAKYCPPLSFGSFSWRLVPSSGLFAIPSGGFITVSTLAIAYVI
jgi:hypothetical protein